MSNEELRNFMVLEVSTDKKDKTFTNYEITMYKNDLPTRVRYGTVSRDKKYDKRNLSLHALVALCEANTNRFPNMHIKCETKEQRVEIENVLMENRMDKLSPYYERKYKQICSFLANDVAPQIEFVK